MAEPTQSSPYRVSALLPPHVAPNLWTHAMHAALGIHDDRQPVATVEIEDTYESLYELRRIVPPNAVLQEHRSHAPPRGLLWVDVLISGEVTDPQWAADAADAVALLETSARALQSYRLVARERWLRPGVAP